MLVFYLISFGILAGIASSVPIGPSNLWIANAALSPNKKMINALTFSFGVVLMDVFYAWIAFWGYFALFDETAFGSVLRWGGSVGLIVLGVVDFLATRKKIALTEPVPTEAKPALLDFVSGAFLCGSNPAFVLFWLFLVGVVDQYSWSDGLKTWTVFWAFAGVAIGDLLWYFGFYKLIELSSKYISEKVLVRLRQVCALGLIAFGVTTLIWK